MKKEEKKRQVIEKFFHSQIQAEISAHDSTHKPGMEIHRDPRDILIEENLWNTKSIIKEYNLISDKKSKLSSTVRKFVSGICTRAYAKTQVEFNPKLNALKKKTNV